VGKWATYRLRGTAQPGERLRVLPDSASQEATGFGNIGIVWVSDVNPTLWEWELWRNAIGDTLEATNTSGAANRSVNTGRFQFLVGTSQSRVRAQQGSFWGPWINTEITTW